MAPGVFAVAKELQRHLAWLQHINRRVSVTAPGSTSVKTNRLMNGHNTTRASKPWASWTRMPGAAVRR
jgi:hypothetical protein